MKKVPPGTKGRLRNIRLTYKSILIHNKRRWCIHHHRLLKTAKYTEAHVELVSDVVVSSRRPGTAFVDLNSSCDLDTSTGITSQLRITMVLSQDMAKGTSELTFFVAGLGHLSLTKCTGTPGMAL